MLGVGFVYATSKARSLSIDIAVRKFVLYAVLPNWKGMRKAAI